MACEYCEKIGRNPAFIAGCDETYGDIFVFATWVERYANRSLIRTRVDYGNKHLINEREINFCPMCGERLDNKLRRLEDAIDSVIEKYPNTIEMLGDD